MSILRAFVAMFVVAGLSAGAMAEEKKADNKKLIVGKWEAVKVEEGTLPKGSIVEFKADGKLAVTAEMNGKKEVTEGTYTVDGDTFTVVLKFDGNEIKLKVKIEKLNETDLDTANEEGKKVGFKRVKK